MLQPDFSKGLLPVVLQHYADKNVLMLGYMNEEAFTKTCEEKVVTFYSRSKERLWTKGESSGNFQYVKSMHLDCDSDALLITVDPVGPTCHKGTESCFDLDPAFPVTMLESTVQDRAQSDNEKSYTNYLLNEGLDKITKKFGEEAFEVVIAAMKRDKKELTDEISDLLYHLTVLMHDAGVTYKEVEAVLNERHSKQNNFKGERPNIEKW